MQIRIEAASGSQVPEGPDPADAEGVRLVKLGQPGGALRSFMSYACLKQMLAHAQRHRQREVGGVVLGRICRSRLGLVTVMAEALPAVRTDADWGHVTFSHESWEEIYTYVDSLAQRLQIVGWYHSHPGFGVFFSHHDSFIQQNFFSSPGQCGVVIDPVNKALACFCCQDGALHPLGGLWVSTTAATYAIVQQTVGALEYSRCAGEPNGWLRALAQPVWKLLRGQKR